MKNKNAKENFRRVISEGLAEFYSKAMSKNIKRGIANAKLQKQENQN
jgi:hypothetical protein